MDRKSKILFIFSCKTSTHSNKSYKRRARCPKAFIWRWCWFFYPGLTRFVWNLLSLQIDSVNGALSTFWLFSFFYLFLERKKKTLHDGKDLHVVDGSPDIFPHSHSYHVPIFTLSISIFEVSYILDKTFLTKILTNSNTKDLWWFSYQ